MHEETREEGNDVYGEANRDFEMGGQWRDHEAERKRARIGNLYEKKYTGAIGAENPSQNYK